MKCTFFSLLICSSLAQTVKATKADSISIATALSPPLPVFSPLAVFGMGAITGVSVRVEGTVYCGTYRTPEAPENRNLISDLPLFLFEDDLTVNDSINRTKTNSTGHFVVSGFDSELHPFNGNAEFYVQVTLNCSEQHKMSLIEAVCPELKEKIAAHNRCRHSKCKYHLYSPFVPREYLTEGNIPEKTYFLDMDLNNSELEEACFGHRNGKIRFGRR